MKTVLVFEYQHQLDDGIGTRSDALRCAYGLLSSKLANADTMDDVAAIFTEIRHEPS